MKKLPSVFIVILCCESLRAEYKWISNKWEWVEPDRDLTGGADLMEGSGAGDTEDDDDYDYGRDYYDEERDLLPPGGGGGGGGKEPPFGGAANLPAIGITDDEDFVEGSGGDRDSAFDSFETVEGSGGGPSSTASLYPSIDLDSPDPGLDDTDYTVLGGGGGTVPDSDPDHSNFDDDDDYFANYEEPTSGGRTPIKDDGFRFEETIVVEETTSTTTTTSARPTISTSTTTTTSTYKPIYKDTPTVSDVPTNRPVSFFAQPGILAAVIGGAVVGLLCAILLVMFIVYRMRKKDEGSYILDEPKRIHNGNLYTKTPNREFYA